MIYFSHFFSCQPLAGTFILSGLSQLCGLRRQFVPLWPLWSDKIGNIQGQKVFIIVPLYYSNVASLCCPEVKKTYVVATACKVIYFYFLQGVILMGDKLFASQQSPFFIVIITSFCSRTAIAVIYFSECFQ